MFLLQRVWHIKKDCLERVNKNNSDGLGDVTVVATQKEEQ